MENNSQQIEKTRNIRNILLPDWTQEEILQEVKCVPKVFQNLEQNTEQQEQTEQQTDPVPAMVIPQWVAIVQNWTPKMTVLAWPKINQIIDQYGEESAAAWVCEQSIKFFGKHLTSNIILAIILLTSD